MTTKWRTESDAIAIGIGVRAFPLAVVEVCGSSDLNTCEAPGIRELIGVIDVHID
ncbi:MAG: hypothetical protein M3Z66_03770 [Chloroflexota bacterium]|nr:hypothetical protein [Chloroflexota bacterium]